MKMPKISKNKQNGTVYTPKWIVNLILDKVGYEGKKILYMKIIEPGCGTGAFLEEICRRYISEAKNQHLRESEIITGLEKNIYGFDIDGHALKIAKRRLDSVLKENHIVGNVKWNIHLKDIVNIKFIKEYSNFFDYVVGNPPYVRIHNLSRIHRDRLKSDFDYCKTGTTDLYIAFFEIGLNIINDYGILGYITPNTYLRNSACNGFRRYLIDNRAVRDLIDFGHEKIFNKATTYSLITLIDFSKKNYLNYFKGFSNKEIVKVDKVKYSDLEKDGWYLGRSADIQRLKSILNERKKVSDIAYVSNGLATLADKLFIFNNVKFRNNYAVINYDNRNYEIEKKIIRKIVKASTYKGYDQHLYVVFPYEKIGDRYIPIDEKKLMHEFPNCYNYFLSVKDKLVNRDIDKDDYWYCFGRSQGLKNVDKQKIITSNINLKPSFYKINKELVYSGIYIVPEINAELLLKKLNSNKMNFYIKFVGKDFQNGYKSYSANSIKNFGISVE